MLHRSITLTHMGLLLIAAFLSFLAVRSYEEMATTVPSGTVWVNSSTEEAELARTVEAVEGFAEETGVSVALETPDLHDPGSVRHLYLAPGAPGAVAADWLDSGYPSFGHAPRTEVHPFGELEQSDPRGFYQVFGSQEDTAAFEEAIAEVGLHDTFGETAQELRWFDLFRIDGDLSTALFIVVLFAVTVTASGVLLNARSYGVLRLQGYSYGRILGRDLAQLARFYLVGGAAAVASVVLALFLYNGLAQFGLFATVVGWLLLLFLAAGVCAHAFALALLYTFDLPGALKGRMPTRLANLSAYAVRVPALLFVLSVIGAVAVSAQNLRAQEESAPSFDRAGEASRIALAGSVDARGQGDDQREELIADWLSGADAEGQVILTAQERGESLLPPGSPRPEFDVLVVNDTFLEHEEVRAPDGQRYGAGDGARLLVPEARSDQEELARGAAEWIGYFDGERSEGGLEVLPSADGQRIFTYGSEKPGEFHSHPHLDDPVVLALPNGGLADALYFSYATRSAIVFPDPGAAEATISQEPFSTYVNGLQKVATGAADHHASLVRDLRLQGFNLAAATAVLLMTAVAVCVIHVRTQAQTIFARHLSGWRFAATHRRLLLVEGALAAAFVGWVVWRTAVAVRRYADPEQPVSGLPTAAVLGLQPYLAVTIAAAGLLLILATLAHFHRRIVREGASQA